MDSGVDLPSTIIDAAWPAQAWLEAGKLIEGESRHSGIGGWQGAKGMSEISSKTSLWVGAIFSKRPLSYATSSGLSTVSHTVLSNTERLSNGQG